MQYKINDFLIDTGKRAEEFEEQIAVPTKISYGKAQEFKWKHKTREFTVFETLQLFHRDGKRYYQVINDLFDFIEFIEVLKGYTSKKLEDNITYSFNSFKTKIAKKNQIKKLMIEFNRMDKIYLDKLECSILAAKLSKIVQRCEAWQE